MEDSIILSGNDQVWTKDEKEVILKNAVRKYLEKRCVFRFPQEQREEMQARDERVQEEIEIDYDSDDDGSESGSSDEDVSDFEI